MPYAVEKDANANIGSRHKSRNLRVNKGVTFNFEYYAFCSPVGSRIFYFPAIVLSVWPTI